MYLTYLNYIYLEFRIHRNNFMVQLDSSCWNKTDATNPSTVVYSESWRETSRSWWIKVGVCTCNSNISTYNCLLNRFYVNFSLFHINIVYFTIKQKQPLFLNFKHFKVFKLPQHVYLPPPSTPTQTLPSTFIQFSFVHKT